MEAPEPRLAATPKKDTRRLGAIRHKARLEEAAASVSRLKAKLRGGASKLEMDDTENVMKDDMEVEDGRNEVDQEVERVTRPANTFFTRQEIDRANFFRTLHPNLAYEHKGMSEALFRELSLKALFPGILHTFPALPSKFLYNRLRQEGQRRLELLAASPEPPLTQDLLDTKKPESAVLVTDAFADQQKQAYKEPVRLRRPKSSDPQQIVSKPAVPAPTKPRNLEERFAQEFNKEFPAWPTPPSSLTEGEYNALLIRARYGHVLSDLPFRMNRMQFNAWEAAGRRKAQNIERLSTQQPTPAATTIVDLTIND
ncbi:hypothetical protein EJ05DRAFT_261384 [Pseudovirgaria hyperparasitica]|uniref:Uncharacterized protein n=1 Tax=Pseudovirgaria hyperparasitica TaxID=470096 RepID=A0A6A6WGL7_9PEZI|nr:uncharacterized protein EJ05DRAFT_261384 [Pseudovirgaria hyperparasitica]KAF2761359.1 hypothetical protein EJ05DRAFT_261384 [Pseudovirgaria hyperparasitica]